MPSPRMSTRATAPEAAPVCPRCGGTVTADGSTPSPDPRWDWVAGCDDCADYDVTAGTGATPAEAIADYLEIHRGGQ